MFAAVLLAYPLLRGEHPWAYYSQFFPGGGRVRESVHGLTAAGLYLVLLYLAWLLTDNVRYRVRHGAKKLTLRLAGVPLTAVLVALVEEMLFRGMLLADLLESLPPVAAIAVGAGVYAGAHYVRSVKRYWTLTGHLALGVLFCLAFVVTGALWLPVGLHAGGVLVLMGVRPFVRYVGPPWLVGASIFPYAGVVGLGALVLLTVNMWLCYGVQS
jgi:membrane protease YdiL (CAAX protease family)